MHWAVGIVHFAIGWINPGGFSKSLFCDPVPFDHLSIVSNMPTHMTNLERIYGQLSNLFLTSVVMVILCTLWLDFLYECTGIKQHSVAVRL